MNLKLAGAMCLAFFAASAANAGIIYTVSDAGGGSFSISGASAADNDAVFTGSGATLPIDSDDLLIAFINDSSSTLLDISITGNGSDPFGFDSSGPWGGSYVPPDGSVTENPGGTCSFCDNGDILFTNGLAPGGTAFAGLENDATGVLANAALSVADSTPGTPEPATLALAGLGLAVVAIRRRRKA